MSFDRVSFSSFNYSMNFDSIAKILLIGDTGSGKSTFVNYLYNYFYNGDLAHLKIAIPSKYHPSSTEECIHDELNIDDNTRSKTNRCIQYMFTDIMTNKQYLFLDTPGLSDTRGTEQRTINMTRIIDATTQLGSLTAVIIVVNGSVSRLTASVRSIFASLHGNLPDSVLENVIVVLTNVKQHESSFDVKILNLHGKVYPFYMQNNALVSDPQTWTKSIRADLEIDWNHSMNQIGLILQTIDSFKQLSITGFLEMKQIRHDIRSAVHQVRLDLIHMYKLQHELAQFDSKGRRNHQTSLAIQTIDKIEIVDALYYNTLCTNCNQVCHHSCHLEETKTFNSQISSQCIMMDDCGRCQQCRNHCPYAYHYYAKKDIQISRTTLYDILIDLKSKYDQNYDDRNVDLERNFNRAEIKILLDKALKEKIDKLKLKTMELCGICSSFNLIRELKFFIRQLKKEVTQFEDYETRIQNEQVIQSLTTLIRNIEENQEQYRQQRPSMQIIERKSSDNKPIDIKLLQISDLLELHKKSTDRVILRSIVEELYRREQGKSIGPLSRPDEILMIGKCSDKYRHKSVHDLSYAYRKLQKQINDVVNADIFKIIDVDPQILIENFILQTLLDEKEKTEHNHEDKSLGTPSLRARSMNCSFSTPYPSTETPYPSTRSTNVNSRPIGFTHILSAPYPVSNESSLLPELPVDHMSASYSSNQQSQIFFPPQDYRYSSSYSQNSMPLMDSHVVIPMPMPMPTNDEHPLMNIDHLTVRFPLTNTNEYQDEMSFDQRSPRPDVVPCVNDLLSSPLVQRRNQIAAFDLEKFRTLENSELLSMYTKASAERNEVRKAAIHQELERRCYGEYPMLMKEKRSLVEERLKANETKTIAELLVNQATVQRKIRKHLNNDDVTLIDDIPIELIIEANVLSQLIVLQGIV